MSAPPPVPVPDAFPVDVESSATATPPGEVPDAFPVDVEASATATPPGEVLNAFTVDVEDYFQVSAFADAVPRSRWDEHEVRVERNTRALLDLLLVHGVRGTFFVLGWVADRRPALLREIRDRGHEVASHGYEHRLVDSMTPEEFRADLARAAEAIERACGVRVRGFRAPSFSVSEKALWAFDVLREEGYAFSSSVFPVRHDRYGIPSFPRRPVRLADGAGRSILEFPMTTWRVLGRNLPAAGGGWLRFLPPAVTRKAIRAANAQGDPAIVYVHPWEVDPDQPRIAASRMSRFRHYLNLDRTAERVDDLLRRFRFGTVSEALERVGASAGTVVLGRAAPAREPQVGLS
jgi:polysaccharide deacetylase family protein (PEP-CTERM system associated)